MKLLNRKQKDTPVRLEKQVNKTDKYLKTIQIILFLILLILICILIATIIYQSGSLESTNYYYRLHDII